MCSIRRCIEASDSLAQSSELSSIPSTNALTIWTALSMSSSGFSTVSLSSSSSSSDELSSLLLEWVSSWFSSLFGV